MIKEFQGEYRFLSNFYPSPFKYYYVEFPTVEHFYQSLKTDNPDKAEKIRLAETPGKAKRLGQRVTLSNLFIDNKINIMRLGLKLKFDQNTHLKRLLVDTHPLEIYEGNRWNDTFWGVVWNSDGTTYIGNNHLGKLLMELRERYNEE